ncbi:hypothetical protein M5689_023913 [Euphorbia peplus]|nr:hypothetical protein M5689_023913 [Euphorbia peplus]
MAKKVSSLIIICLLFGILQKCHLPSQIGAEARKLSGDIHIPPNTSSNWSTRRWTEKGKPEPYARVCGSHPDPPSSNSMHRTTDRILISAETRNINHIPHAKGSSTLEGISEIKTAVHGSFSGHMGSLAVPPSIS